GRHIFNPAAFGVVLLGLCGFATELWWVGSEVLFFFLVAAFVIIIIRLEKVVLALTYLAVANAMTVSALMYGGQSFFDAVHTSFVSYPFLFLITFMLVEPLTLPPRRRQQYGVALLVAVLSALQLFMWNFFGVSLSWGHV